MKYPALLIANYFIELAKLNHQSLTPLKLIKLIYFSQGWSLGLRNKSLITEPIEAWQYGPVIPSVYHFFKKFGNNEITESAPAELGLKNKLIEDSLTKTILNKIWDVYGNYSAIQLANMTHEKGTPWDIAWNEQQGKIKYNLPIEDNLLHNYFSTQAKENSKATG